MRSRRLQQWGVAPHDRRRQVQSSGAGSARVEPPAGRGGIDPSTHPKTPHAAGHAAAGEAEDAPRTMPAWLNNVVDALVGCEVFTLEGKPTNCLVNEYEIGQGIMYVLSNLQSPCTQPCVLLILKLYAVMTPSTVLGCASLRHASSHLSAIATLIHCALAYKGRTLMARATCLG